MPPPASTNARLPLPLAAFPLSDCVRPFTLVMRADDMPRAAAEGHRLLARRR